MHSKIFQITTTKVDKECYLNEDTLMQGDNSYFDYCDKIDEEERKYHIDVLVNHILPKGMFELVDEDTIRYIGGRKSGRKNLSQVCVTRWKPLLPTLYRIGLARSISLKNT